MTSSKHDHHAAAHRRSGPFASRFGNLPRTFALLWAGTLINRAGTFVAPFLTIFLTQYHHLGHAAVTPVLMGYGVGVLLSSPLGGQLADRIGRGHAMVLGLSCAAACQLLLALARGPVAVGASVFLLGLSSDLFRPAANALVVDIVPAQDRPRAFGLLHWALNLAIPIAALGAGWFATRSWTPLFVLDALTSLSFAALIGWKLLGTAPRLGPAPAEAGEAPRTRSWNHWRDGALAAACLASLMTFAVYFQTSYTVPLRTIDTGLHAGGYGVMMALNGVLIAVVQPLIGPTLSRIPRLYGLGGGVLLVGIGVALTGAARTLPLLLLTVVVWSLGEIGVAALLPALVADLAPEDARGRYMGAFGVGLGAAGVLSPLGVTVYRANAALLWWACAALGALAFAVLGRLDRIAVHRRSVRGPETSSGSPVGVESPTPPPAAGTTSDSGG
ncbi:MFS family permease [Kitasatospora sp. MAP12-15]|uniref:MFS transporter n=1 Tax=unclassified Kitasatospora TaxID=2633591 RepID=UPI002475A02C|nr:MFS transporter [Kitasatospora sp. MAP12-44]MDH6113591.1 MFS family permease [Kitasatospora sp. MAP12-44]